MRQRFLCVLLILTVFCLAPGQLISKDHYRALNRPDHFYYGHISYVETVPGGPNPVVLREGRETPEPAVLNLPLGPGDMIRTTEKGRCEIQFDTATIVRLDYNTELGIETILAQSLSSPQELSNLVLNKGRIYVMYKEYHSREMFQILTPHSAVKMKHKSVAMLSSAADGFTDIQVRRGKASVLFGSAQADLKKREIKKLERLIVRNDTQFQLADYIPDTDFEAWNETINKDFEDLHEGRSSLPKPIRTLPKAVFYFAQQYGNLHGEWIWDSMMGYVWRPFMNNSMYPSGWQPYVFGHWSVYKDQMFWIPDEPWGWVPYHLGIWHWDKKLGWVWLPGSFFAPAWADWDFFFGHYSWRPWTIWDWYWAGSADRNSVYAGYGFEYREGDWRYRWPGEPDFPSRRPATTVRLAQLKRPSSGVLPIPRELEGVFKRVVTAYESGDSRFVDSMRQVPTQLVFVSQDELNTSRIQEKVMRWDQVSRTMGSPHEEAGPVVPDRVADPGLRALRVFLKNDRVRDHFELDEKGEFSPGSETPSAGMENSRVKNDGRPESSLPGENPAARISKKREGSARNPAFEEVPSIGPERVLDWNPDVRLARRLGVEIEYSSRTNEVISPKLKAFSRTRPEGPMSFRSSGDDRSSFDPEGNETTSRESVKASADTRPDQKASREGSSGRGGGKKKIKKI